MKYEVTFRTPAGENTLVTPFEPIVDEGGNTLVALAIVTLPPDNPPTVKEVP